MTWKDIKTITLQKMFSISGDTITNDEATNDYIKSMPGAANEAMVQIATNCRGITKKIAIDCRSEQGQSVHCLNDLCDRFYKISEPIYAKKDGKYSLYKDYSMLDENNILLPCGAEYLINCKVYPLPITSDTLDSFVIELHPDEAAVIPLYVASQLYKDDDIGQAVQMLNEYQTRLGELSAIAAELENVRYSSAGGVFTSSYGWC